MREITFDPTLDSMRTKPEEGFFYRIAVDISRRLDLWTGKQVKVYFKDGREIFGVITTFSKDDGNGKIETKNTPLFFHEKEIRNVVLLDAQK